MDTQRLSQTVQPLLDWFQAHARTLPWRADREPYHVWLSEIMLQQTRVEAVRGVLRALSRGRAGCVRACGAAGGAAAQALGGGWGTTTARAKAQECARVIAARGGVWPDTVEGLLALPGIGPYTAGAIASICFERPAAAVDGNVLRVCARVLDDATPIDNAAHKTALTAALSACYPRRALRRFHAGAHGARRDRLRPEPRAAVRGLPDCGAVSRARTRHGLRPAGQGAEARQARRGSTPYSACAAATGPVERRPDSGLLAGLWQLPNTPGLLNEQQAGAFASGQGLGDVRLRSARDGRHIFTHIVWTMRCYTLECSAMPPRYRWATPDELRTEISPADCVPAVSEGYMLKIRQRRRAVRGRCPLLLSRE